MQILKNSAAFNNKNTTKIEQMLLKIRINTTKLEH